MVAAGTGEALPGRSVLRLARKTPFYNRCGAGKWAAAGRESEAAVVPLGPAGQHNLRGGKGRCFVHARVERPGSVSAGVTARSTLAAVRGDRVRALQHALYRAAKADPDRRFHALFDKICRRGVLDRAWEDVRRNRGAAGIDRVSLADAEQYGVSRLLSELAVELREGRYRPLPARRVFIPKPGSPSRGRSRFPLSATGSCRLPRRSCSSRSSRRASCRAVSGSARGARRMMPCRCSLMSPGGAAAGWWKLTSPTAFRRFRMTG